jgi:SAM-dependent methyltransferase
MLKSALTAIVILGAIPMKEMPVQPNPASMFADAEAYNRFMGRWSRRVAPLLIDFAQIRDGDRVLEVGSGTGSLSLTIAASLPGCRVVGIDRSARYVSYAKSQIAGENVRFDTGDALDLPFPAAQFDAATSLLVLNFIPDARKAVAEMRRVTRSGGTISAAVWEYGGGMEMLRMFWDAAVRLDPAAEPQDEKHMPLSRSGELAGLFRAAGLVDVRETPLEITTHFKSWADYWSPFLDGQGPAGAYVAGLTPENRSALHDRLKSLLASRQGAAGGYPLRARVWAARATIP